MTIASQQAPITVVPPSAPPVSDFNGDGTSDILWHNNNGDTAIWYMSSNGAFAPLDLGVVDTSWTPVATGDFNASGRAGILWRNSNGEVGEWLNRGGTGPASFTRVDLGHVDASWVIQGTGDFNGDGTSDILWRNTNGDTGIWYGVSAGGYSPMDVGVVDARWSVQGISVNGLNRSGILWRNANGEVGLWQSTGPGTFNKLDLGHVDTSWVIQGYGDFNGDGMSDILWRNTNGDAAIWFVSGDGSFNPVDLGVVDPSWSIQAVGDYNDSGKAGILWRNTNGNVGEWLNTSGPGPGFSGFNKIVLANIDPASGWNIVGGNPPAVTPAGTITPAAMAHAMAATGAPTAAPQLVHAVAPPATIHAMIAAPAIA